MNLTNKKIWIEAINDCLDYQYFNFWESTEEEIFLWVKTKFKNNGCWFYEWTKNLSNRTIKKMVLEFLKNETNYYEQFEGDF